MPTTKKLLGFDLGAESGRGVAGLFDGERIQLDVVHRFANGGVRLLEALHWDVLRLFEEMKNGLRACSAKHGAVDSLGVDTWGVDFALLGRDGGLLGNPRHYRDPHTEHIMEATFARVPREEIFRQTGLQFMRFNSLFQLLALQRDRSPILDAAEHLLFIPDLFHYWFTGRMVNEFTIASTSQFYDPTQKAWAYGLFEQLGLPKRLLESKVPPGMELGPLAEPVAKELGVPPMPVVAPASHDTAAAVAAVPAQGVAQGDAQSWCYISSGTWSLMGAETTRPIINDLALKYNFTNEGGVSIYDSSAEETVPTIRLLKNVMGLWLVQECRRAWERAGKSYTYDELTRLAEQSPPLVSVVDPDHDSFILPDDMPKAIADFCVRTGQPVPVEPGAVVRCALESLALRYRWVLDRLEELLGRRLEVIHIVGGGSQNRLLNQLTADACNRVVLAGPVEATALGNVLVQAMGLGLIDSLADLRAVVRRSFEPHRFEPKQPELWRDRRA